MDLEENIKKISLERLEKVTLIRFFLDKSI